MNECDFVERRLIAHCRAFILDCHLERVFWGWWQALLVRKQGECVCVYMCTNTAQNTIKGLLQRVTGVEPVLWAVRNRSDECLCSGLLIDKSQWIILKCFKCLYPSTVHFCNFKCAFESAFCFLVTNTI